MLDLHGHPFALVIHDELFCCEGPEVSEYLLSHNSTTQKRHAVEDQNE